MPKILTITPYPSSSADTRYRIMQFIPFLKRNGYEIKVRPFMNEALFKIYYKEGNTLKKYWLTMVRLVLRIIDVFILAKNFDVIFIHKECFPFGPPLFELYLKRINKKIIYDMDDAFWAHPPQFKQIGRSFRDSQKIQKILKISNSVLAGNEYLKKFSLSFNKNVEFFPTVLDTNIYLPRVAPNKGFIEIGWIGRWSSQDYLFNLSAVFKTLSSRYGHLKFKFIGTNPDFFIDGIPMKNVNWALENEISSMYSFHIGIMPLPNDEYSLGKCGFKLLQYMALGIPSVASPVGVNAEIIQDGYNGFLALSNDEWITKLSLLIEDNLLREKIGRQGRKTVETKYSLQIYETKLLSLLESNINESNRSN